MGDDEVTATRVELDGVEADAALYFLQGAYVFPTTGDPNLVTMSDFAATETKLLTSAFVEINPGF